MRITGGLLAGRIIRVPQGEIRPAMDRLRESVFGSLGDLSSFSFLDLFTGSGIIALEAASRGAAYIEAVEQDKQKQQTLLQNVSISPVRINCRFMSCELYVKRAKNNFDIIFLDPPFPYKYKWKLLSEIVLSCLVKDNTRILIHRPQEDYLKAEIDHLVKTDSRQYGRSVVDFFIVRNRLF